MLGCPSNQERVILFKFKEKKYSIFFHSDIFHFKEIIGELDDEILEAENYIEQIQT